METMFLQDLVFLKKTVIYQTELITGLVVVLFIFRRFVVTCFSHDTQVIYIAAFILTIQFFYLSFFAAGAGLLTGIFQAEGKGMPAVIMSVTRGLVLIPAIVIGNQLFQLNGVVFSLLVSEAISCMTGCVMYYLIRSK